MNGIALNFLRTQLVTVPGASVPFPYGGKQRQVMVNLNPQLMQAKGLSPNEVLTALENQNLILPGGTSKIGQFEYDVDLNGDLKTVQEFNNLPIKKVGDAIVYLHDVIHEGRSFPIDGPMPNAVPHPVSLRALRGGSRGSYKLKRAAGWRPLCAWRIQPTAFDVSCSQREACPPRRTEFETRDLSILEKFHSVCSLAKVNRAHRTGKSSSEAHRRISGRMLSSVIARNSDLQDQPRARSTWKVDVNNPPSRARA